MGTKFGEKCLQLTHVFCLTLLDPHAEEVQFLIAPVIQNLENFSHFLAHCANKCVGSLVLSFLVND